MSIAFLVVGSALLVYVVFQRLTWLAPTRMGWLFYLANVIGEIAPKRIGTSRWVIETAVSLAGIALIGLGSISLVAVAAAGFVLLVLVIATLRSERRLLGEGYTKIDTVSLRPDAESRAHGLARGFPFPSTHPRLTITFNGPFTARAPKYNLGTLVTGRMLSLEVIVGNHALTPTQTKIRVAVELPESLGTEAPTELTLPPLSPAQVHTVRFPLVAHSIGRNESISVRVLWGNAEWTDRVLVDRVVDERPNVHAATICRYPGASRAAFCWRGDMDAYDTSTFQSIEGLENTLRLAARYRLPQTMYLSTRLSLDEDEAKKRDEHYGIDRGSSEIPRFVDWMRQHVDLQHRAEYPYEPGRPFVMELGNHGHLHFGDNSSSCAENGWNPAAKFGAGPYPWLTDTAGTFEEQRDNALEARRLDEQFFGFTPRSWAMPDRTRDENTPAAMVAAGCEVLSDSDVRTRDNVLFQPRPHFALGTDAVELTKRYPGDPQHVLHVWMNLFWIYRAHRLGIPVVFMCHQHMRLFDGWACTRFTEAILRRVVDDFRGDLWINTVYGIGVYWRDVLSEKRQLTLEVTPNGVKVRNGSPLPYRAIPIDLDLNGGGKTTVLVDLEPGQEALVDAKGVQ